MFMGFARMSLSMLLLLVALVHLIYFPCDSASGDLPLHPHATLINEVTSIYHDEAARHVLIHLAEERKCNQPTFMIRLSGMSLYLLDIVPNDHTNSSSVTFRYPPLHETGMYFLEVLTLYCETLDPNSFINMCLVNPYDDKNFLTLPYSFEVKSVAPTEGSNPRRARWVLGHGAIPAILPTRYQKWCPNGWCKAVESDVAQHNLYEWTDKPPYEHLIAKTFELDMTNVTEEVRTGDESITICMVGASHAHKIALHGNALKLKHINFAAETSRYPQLFNVRTLTHCSYAVLGYGQWPLSYIMGKEPYNAARYEKEMRRVLSAVVAANLSTQVFVNSMNINPMGYREFSCPAGDYRHPPIVMMYNKILSNLCAEYKIPFIDLYPVQGPLWDIALDWNHPIGRVFTAEAEFIVHSMLSYSHTNHRAPPLDPDFAARVMPPLVSPSVRFADSDTLYMLLGGQYRAFPNELVKNRLAAGWRPTVIINATTENADHEIGPPIPDI